jgi:UDP-N-acetylglucosamine 2-epimerase (non-hydrolysing)
VPDIDLHLLEPDQDLHTLTSRVMIKVSRVLEQEKPDLLLVQGDTTTVMTVSLAAFYQKVPVGTYRGRSQN